MGKILLGKVALTPKGAFVEEREGGYARLDVVSSGTQSYVSLKDHNVSPLTEASAWMPYMSVELSGGGGGGEVTPQPQPIIVDSVPEPAGKAFCPDGKKIMICGASFSENGNGWDKLLQDGTGISVVNKSQGGSNIRYMAQNMIDASSGKRHGTLFMEGGKDIFNEVGVLIIMYTHNDNVLLTEEAYKSRDVAWYKSHTSEVTSTSSPLASSFDYVLKQIKEWCRDYHKDSDSNLNQNLEIVDNQMQILICSNWHEGREYYNQSSRLLAIRHNVAYCPLDKELGFGADNLITDTSFTSKIDNHNGAVTRFNASILHGQHTTNNEPSDNGRVEYITDKDGNEVAWGWHPQRSTPTVNTESIDYGYGTMITRNNNTFAVPWIQRAIANSIIGHLNFNPVQEI